MNRDEDGGGQGGAHRPSSQFIEPNGLAEDGLGGRDAEADNNPWFHDLYFSFQPRSTGCDLRRRWFLVFATLALGFPFEMLDGIGDVNVLPDDAGLSESLVHYFSGRTDEWMAGHVFLVARLLTDEHDRRMGRAFAKDGLGGMFVQIASRAARC